MDDLAAQASRKGAAHSKFLTSAEGEEARQAFRNRRDVILTLDGGFAKAERAVAIFTNPDWGEYERENVLAALQITRRKQDSISHRDILGAALALGIERTLLGDIFIGETSYLVCLADIAGFIRENLTRAGSVGLCVKRVPLADLPEVKQTLEEHRDTVASLRLDAVTAAMFGLSRGTAAEYIEQGRVQLAHRTCEDTSKSVAAGEIISVRGLGRGKLLEIGGASTKGRIWVRFGIYV
jgi:RNA-binding protein YlmH